MEKLFGIPVDTLMLVLLVALGIIAGVIGILAARHPVFFRMGLRNIPRRWGRTGLIVVGLMLGTAIISAALGTGDIMSSTIRSSVLDSLGNIDEIVSFEHGVGDDQIFVETVADIEYFDESLFHEVRNSLIGNPLVDGVAPVIIEPVAVQDVTSLQNEPRVTIFAMDPDFMGGFGQIEAMDGRAVSLASLGPGDIYLNEEAADELNAKIGDELRVFAAGRSVAVAVKEIVRYDGTGTEESAILTTLAEAQGLLAQPGRIKHIIVSNTGDATGGAKYSGEVLATLEPVVTPLGLEVEPTKQDAMDFADEMGSGFTSIFMVLGTFSIVAGMMLIFLIFVMLAAERKTEMGIARAVGTQRHHLIEMFLFEGAAYDLMGATVGAALGLGVALGMVFLMAQALSTMGLNITYAFRLQSLIVGFSLGILLTFLVVSVSAWRVSLLNIVTAIRDLPEPALRKGRRVLVFGILALVIGLLMALSGLSSKQATPFHMGVSLIAISLVPLLLRARVPDRIAFTVPGVLLVVWWLLPFDALDAILPELSSDMSIFIISGIMLIVGSTWVVMYNSDLLIRGVMRAFGRFRNVAPGLRIAISYPMAYRFRTGMTLAMFSLVVFTLVVMATLTGSFDGALDDLDTFGGGFDVLATTIPVNPVNDMEAALAESTILSPGDLELVASQSISSAEARQIGVEGKSFESYLVRGLDDAFLGNTTYQFATTAEGYESDRDVWQALAENPGLAVIDPFTVPRRENLGFMLGAPDFQLEGFFLEDENFAPVDVEVINPQTGEGDILTIIGVFRDTVPFFMIGMSTSQAWVEASFGLHTAPTVHFLKTSSNVDAEFVARSMESAFLANGMEAESLEDELNEALSTSRTFNYIIQGFMGLGLVVGVAALGVISARSVVERRQEIGVLRAIGFQGRMVQFSFLLESSFIALLSIAVGVTLGLILSWNIIQDTAETSSWENLSFIVPWVNLLIIFGLTYISALLMTFLPARQASRVYPAEALRYE